MALALGTLATTNAQSQGDWYVGTGDVSNVAWTEWAVSPTIGYGATDNIMLSLSVSQELIINPIVTSVKILKSICFIVSIISRVSFFQKYLDY